MTLPPAPPNAPWVARAARGWFGFWFSPRGRAVTVWLAWFGLSVALAGFVAKYGQNIPSWEEWVFLPGLLGEYSRWDWFTERLQEHRYPLGRAVFLVLFELSGRDFRSGMYASVVVMAGAAALLIGAARAVRGRTDFADIAIPLLLLNPGAYENYILGYQIQFSLDVLLAAAVVRSAASPTPNGWRILLDGGLIALLALGGWIGLAFVPGGVAWLGWRAWAWFRRNRNVAAAGFLLPPLAAAGYFAWSYWEIRQNPLPGAPPPNPWDDTARVWMEFLVNAFGTVGSDNWPATGWTMAAVFTATTLSLAWAVFTRLAHRETALGWLAVLGAVALMGYGLACRRPNGFAPRNLPFGAIGVVVAYLTALRWSGRFPLWVRWTTAVLLVAGAGYVYGMGWKSGRKYASFFRERNTQFLRDRDTGLPLNYLASRHQPFPVYGFALQVRLLRDRGHPAAAGIPDPPALRGEQLPILPPTFDPIPGDPDTGRGRPAVWKFENLPEPDRYVHGVKVIFRYPDHANRVPMHVLWRTADGRVKSSLCQPWLTPVVWELDFPVGDRPRTLWFRTLDEGPVPELIAVFLLLPLDSP